MWVLENTSVSSNTATSCSQVDILGTRRTEVKVESISISSKTCLANKTGIDIVHITILVI